MFDLRRSKVNIWILAFIKRNKYKTWYLTMALSPLWKEAFRRRSGSASQTPTHVTSMISKAKPGAGYALVIGRRRLP